MANLREIIHFIEQAAPVNIADEGDNVGLLVDSGVRECNNVLVSLDTDRYVVQEAKELDCELIISHHPLIYTPVKNIKSQDALYKLISNDISLYSAHTNVDSAEGGLCDFLFEKICNFTDSRPILGGELTGLGRIAQLSSKITLTQLISDIKNALYLKDLRFIGDTEAEISTVAICSGGGPGFIYDAEQMGADVYISGDFKYHHARFAYENNMALIELSHYDSEIIFMDYMAKLLSENFNGNLKIHKSQKNINPWKII